MRETDEKQQALVNKVVDILKVEMDGGFLENTAKYKDKSEEIIYSCLRAVAVQIINELDKKEVNNVSICKLDRT